MATLLKPAFGLLSVFVIQAAPVQAQTFISAAGNDANACSYAAPCRTLQRGVNVTGAGRELTILTSGEFGPATLNKGITILAEGVSANIRAFAANSAAITINAPGGKVALKGLFMNGGHTGGGGVNIAQAASVHIEDCAFERFVYTGIRLVSANTELFVVNSVSRNNGDDGLGAPVSSLSNKIVVDNSRFENNGDDGLYSLAGRVAITRSVFSGNGNASTLTGNGIRLGSGGGSMNVMETTASGNAQNGFYVESGSMNVTASAAVDNQTGFRVKGGELTLDGVVTRGNGYGLNIHVDGSAWIANSTVTKNTYGVDNSGALYTRGDSIVAGNDDTNYDGSSSPLPVDSF